MPAVYLRSCGIEIAGTLVCQYSICAMRSNPHGVGFKKNSPPHPHSARSTQPKIRTTKCYCKYGSWCAIHHSTQ